MSKVQLTDKLNWGQYVGMTYAEIGEIDANYLRYLVSNAYIVPDDTLIKALEQTKQIDPPDSSDSNESNDGWDELFGPGPRRASYDITKEHRGTT